MDSEELLQRIDHTIGEAIEAFFRGEAEHKLSLDELHLRIRLTGPAWAGVVDKPVAKFLVDLDEMLTDEFKSLGIPIPENTHGLVALQIQDGSWDAVLKYSKEVFEGFAKLKPTQQILIVGTVLAVVGIPQTDKIISALNQPRVEQIKADEATKEEQTRSQERIALVNAVTKIGERERELQRPMRSLVNKMSDDDRIQLPGKAKALQKDEAKETFTSGARTKSEQYYIDAPFKVESLNTKDPEHWQIGLSFGDNYFRAEVLLSKEEMARLLKDFQEAHSAGKAIAPHMHVTAKVTEKGVVSAKVVGLGEARMGAVRLSKALAEAKLPNQ
ncbi:MAG TPA: hypothetical protein VIM48_03780 [Chthoniobacterales bacterium]